MREKIYIKLAETFPAWDEIAERMQGKKYDLEHFIGKAAKYHLRLTLREAMDELGIARAGIAFPRVPYCHVDQDGPVISLRNHHGGEVSTIDASATLERPALFDIRTGKHSAHKYFRYKCMIREIVLEDMFGPGNYDHALILPLGTVDSNDYAGIAIISMPVTAKEFRECAKAAAKKHKLLQVTG